MNRWFIQTLHPQHKDNLDKLWWAIARAVKMGSTKTQLANWRMIDVNQATWLLGQDARETAIGTVFIYAYTGIDQIAEVTGQEYK
jgi:hypothetical protein